MKRTTTVRMAMVLAASFLVSCAPRPTHPSRPVDVELAEIESKERAAQVERDRRMARCIALPETVTGGAESMRGQCLREVSEWYAARMEELQRARLEVLAKRSDTASGGT